MSEKKTIHRSSVEVFGVQPFGDGCVRITIEDDRGEEFAHVDANAEHCDALTAAMHTALGRPVPRETGWRDLACNARVRFEDGEPVEVEVANTVIVSTDAIETIAFAIGIRLRSLMVYKRPDAPGMRAMVCRK